MAGWCEDGERPAVEIIGTTQCPECGGTGDDHLGWYCRSCDGKGECDVYAPDDEDEA